MSERARVTAAQRAAAEPRRRRGGRRAAAPAGRRTLQVRVAAGAAAAAAAAAVDAQHLDVSVPVEPVRHRPAARTSARRRRPGPRVSRVAAAPAAAAAAAFDASAASTQRHLERAPELERHDVVEDRIDDGADVVEDAGRVEEDRLQRLAGAGALLDVVRTRVDGDETLSVERSPADEERDDHSHCSSHNKAL